MSDQFGEVITLVPPEPLTTESEAPTSQEQDTLNGLVLAIERFGNPSLKEIAACAGRSSVGTGYYAPTVWKYLRGLEDKGYIKLPPRYSCRGRIQVLKRG